MEILTALACLVSLNSSLTPCVASGGTFYLSEDTSRATSMAFRKKEAEMALKHIDSFDDSSFFKKGSEISFSGYKTLDRIYGKTDCGYRDFLISFETSYIFEIDLGFMDLKLLAPSKEKEISHETVYFFPFFNEDEKKKDVRIDVHNFSYFASQVVEDYEIKKSAGDYLEKGKESSAIESVISDSLDPSITESGGFLAEIASLTVAISTFDDAEGLAKSVCPEPSLLDFKGWVYREVKMGLIKINFNNNKNQTIPKDKNHLNDKYIDNQNILNEDNHYQEPTDKDKDYAWAKWRFSFNDMQRSGCGVFAAYNLLVDSGESISLPALISLFELCGADLLYAGFGVQPLPEWYVRIVEEAVLCVVDAAVIGIALLLSNIPFLGPWLGSILLIELGFAHFFLEQTFLRQGSINTVLRALKLSFLENDCVRTEESKRNDALRDDLQYRKQAIVCAWNEADSIKDGAHYFYVVYNDNDQNHLSYISVNNQCVWSKTIDTVYEFYGKTEEEANKRLIAYYVIN